MTVWDSFIKYLRLSGTTFSTWILLSLVFHGVVFKTVDSTKKRLPQKKKPDPVKIQIVSKPTKEELSRKKIIETQFEKTEKPKDAKFLGHTDHKAKKEQKLKKELLHTKKALKAGKKEKVSPSLKERKLRTPSPTKNSAQKQKTDTNEKKVAEKGKVKLKKSSKNPLYKSLLADSQELLAQPLSQKERFRDFVSDDLEEGDSIDLSTTKFRYIGYFTNLRKQIEMTWVYPALAARSGKQGSVFLEFVVAKNGKASKIKVLRTSGYRILDESIVQAINEASPFAPLPKSIGKEELKITGTFYYIISGYSGSYE